MSAAAAENQKACRCDGNDKEIDQYEVERKHPSRAMDFSFVVIFDYGYVKLPRQQDNREERQQRHGDEVARKQSTRNDFTDHRLFECFGKERHRAVKHDKGDAEADGKES